MAETRPTSEQLVLLSSKTGTHSLDTYLEASEKGSRTLYDLLDDVFDSSGKFRSDNFEFQIDDSTGKMQARVGYLSNPSASWTNIADFFQQKGAYATSTAYVRLDVVTDSNSVYVCTVAHTSSTSTPDASKWNTIIDGAALNTATASATASASAASASETAAATSEAAALVSKNAAADSQSYATEWANNAEDSLVSSAAGGDGTDDYSALHHAAKGAASAAAAAVETATAAIHVVSCATHVASASAHATTAATHKTDAETAKTAAETALDEFTDLYLGTKSSDPTLDNDGNALQTGALYHSSTANVMKFYTGSVWNPIQPGLTAEVDPTAIAMSIALS